MSREEVMLGRDGVLFAFKCGNILAVGAAQSDGTPDQVGIETRLHHGERRGGGAMTLCQQSRVEPPIALQPYNRSKSQRERSRWQTDRGSPSTATSFATLFCGSPTLIPQHRSLADLHNIKIFDANPLHPVGFGSS